MRGSIPICGTGDDFACTFGILHEGALACKLFQVWALSFAMDLFGVTSTADGDIATTCIVVCNSSSRASLKLPTFLHTAILSRIGTICFATATAADVHPGFCKSYRCHYQQYQLSPWQECTVIFVSQQHGGQNILVRTGWSFFQFVAHHDL